jgi:hypothetical protein
VSKAFEISIFIKTALDFLRWRYRAVFANSLNFSWILLCVTKAHYAWEMSEGSSGASRDAISLVRIFEKLWMRLI